MQTTKYKNHKKDTIDDFLSKYIFPLFIDDNIFSHPS